MKALVEIRLNGVLGFAFESWLDRGIQQVFLTRELDASGAAESTACCLRIAERLSLKSLILCRQTHSSSVIELPFSPSDSTPSSLPVADGLFSPDISDLSLGVLTADCLPVIIADQNSDARALLHCGWRGTFSGILQVALGCFKRRGIPERNLLIGIGPGACRECYQVREDLVGRLREVEKDNIWLSAEEQGILLLPSLGQFRLDLKKFVSQQAMALGVLKESIFDCDICTICDRRFFSHRREGAMAGRQISLCFGRGASKGI